MKKKAVKMTLTLSHNDIHSLIEKLEEYLQKLQMESRNILQLKLSIEEILLRWQDHFGTEKTVDFICGSRFGQPQIQLCVPGEPCNPLDIQYEELDWSARLLADLGFVPAYTYRRGTNTVWLKLKKKKKLNPIMKIVISALLAIILGVIGVVVAPEQTAVLTTAFLAPVRNTLLGVLSAIAVPMIFLSVMLGVCGTGDTSTFSEIGNKMLSRFIAKLFIFTFIAGILIAPLFNLHFAEGSMDAEQFSGAVQMFLDILPTNLVQPFLTGNTLQIMVISIAFGLAILTLGSRVDSVRKFAEEANSIVYLLLEWVSNLIPLIIFFVLLSTFWGGDFSSLTSIWKPLLVVLVCCPLLPLADLLLTSRRFRVSPLRLMKKMAPTILIALATSSSAAAYSTNVDCCKNRLGIDHRITGFGVPLGAVIYMPLTAIFFLSCIYYGAEQYGVSCSYVWIIVACIIAGLLAIAIPPIPGGAIACYSIMFAQMGIPAEAIVFAVAIEVIVDRFGTASNLAALQLELVSLSGKLGLLDEETLRADN